ncbi:MAG TPA: hypothetical protein VG271_17965 [Beijerinckiaceae bacterium]|jgi:hypothetical protein|nr:hypothetical protein [Beijerinckiaceae bacterium]
MADDGASEPPQSLTMIGARAIFGAVLVLFLFLAASIADRGAAADFAGPSLRVAFDGKPDLVFTPERDACDGADVPDAPLRAFRDNAGAVVAFGMHDVNRALRGPALDALKLDCHVALASGHNADPAAYDDHNWITATWTNDGRVVDALVHHEYHANEHQGRCAFHDFMACWYNTITAYRSLDGGRNFSKNPAGLVVAAPPFRQDVGQGRHRGFFNPSNIVADGPYYYFMAATTGWSGQTAGVCLFRTRIPSDSSSWRAFDGTNFTARFADPYAPRKAASGAQSCQPIAPFPTPVGAIVRHRPSGDWLALFQAQKQPTGPFAVSGFYYATSHDLLHWSAPLLALAGDTLYDDPCGAGGQLINYPSLLDPDSKNRNFADIGDNARLFYVTLAVDGCSVTSRRDLMSQRVRIERPAAVPK